MTTIEDKAISNYHANLDYFRENHLGVYTKLKALETLLETDDYPQKYELEYKDEYFDVVELSSGNTLYNQNSKTFSEELLNNITYKKDDQVFDTIRNYNYDEEALKYIKTQGTFSRFATTAAITYYYNSVVNNSMELIELDKFIFLGTGLGLHIQKITEKFDLQTVLIVEDDIELFRLSLFTCNYKETFDRATVYLSIAQNQDEFSNLFNNFYMKAFSKNKYIKFSVFSSNYEYKIQEIQSLLITRPEATYSQERLLTKSKKVINKLNEEYKFIDLRKKINENFFENKPVLVIAAGPSLHKNIDWLKENYKKFVIIAPLVALKTLKKIDISPDIVVQIDENDVTTKAIIEHIGDLNFLKNSMFMFSASLPDIMFEKFEKENMYLHEDRTKYKLKKSTIPVASVGETMYAISLIFNAPNIYLLGLDLALAEDGTTHAEDHFRKTSVSKDDNSNNNSDKQGYQLTTSIVKVKGNFRDTVSTTPVLAMSIPIINMKTRQYKTANQNIYNLNDGAYFQNTITLKTENVKIDKDIDRLNISNELKKLFDSYSSTSFDEDELKVMEARAKHIEELRSYINIFKEKPYSNKDIFFASYIELVSSILNSSQNNELKEIMFIFNMIITPHISDIFNTKRVDNMKKHIKKLRKLLIEQLENIIDSYDEEFKKLESIK